MMEFIWHYYFINQTLFNLKTFGDIMNFLLHQQSLYCRKYVMKQNNNDHISMNDLKPMTHPLATAEKFSHCIVGFSHLEKR